MKTKTKGITMENLKIHVPTEEISEKVQRHAFGFNRGWRYGGKTVKYTDAKFIFIYGEDQITFDDDEDLFKDHENKEITWQDFLKVTRQDFLKIGEQNKIKEKLIEVLKGTDLPDWAEWVSVDPDGRIDIFEVKPILTGSNSYDEWGWSSGKTNYLTKFNFIVPDWQNHCYKISDLLRDKPPVSKTDGPWVTSPAITAEQAKAHQRAIDEIKAKAEHDRAQDEKEQGERQRLADKSCKGLTVVSKTILEPLYIYRD